MAVSPTATLYRTAGRVVILAGLTLVAAQIVPAQGARRIASKGPRALGLLELAPNGKAHLIPVMIMDDGKFFDASAYKAAPVPMALQPETVYEALRTGVSQGLFTVTGASHLQNTWIGDGTWKSASEIAAAAAKKLQAPAKPKEENLDAPPVLRHSGSEKPKSAEPAPPPAAQPPTATPDPVPSPPPVGDQPVLRRGKPVGPELVQLLSMPETPAAAPGTVQIIPAISDAGGPDPHPYNYELKPEEQQFRKKILALAADEVRARVRQLMPETGASSSAPASPRPGKTPAAKLPQPSFENIQLRVFDLSNSNEPVLVLTVKARMPQRSKLKENVDLQYYVTLVAREDLYGELHKAFSDVTDTRHLDALPRLELIDAVDADGDGRGELLFRQYSDTSSAYSVYRVIGDQLWPLFQGTLGQ